MNAWLTIRNAAPARLVDVPRYDYAQLSELIRAEVEREGRVCALVGMPRGEDATDILAVVAEDARGSLRIAIGTVRGRSFPALTPSCPQVHLFERELAETHGLEPVGHPWLKPVRFPERTRASTGAKQTIGVIDFYRVEGEEVHEVAVGPVHAGVIEPGHFRFQCHGEEVLHLEISLGYQHRGVEHALAYGDPRRRIHYAETLSGDSTIGHAIAYAQAIEGLSGCSPPPRAEAIRGIALELERLANHTGDLGALAGDVGYLPTAAFCGRLRGDWLNLTAAICGNRFGRGVVRPGGVGFDIEPERAQDIQRRATAALHDVTEAVDLLWDAPSVMSRFEDTGRVSTADAAALGLVGPAARACGLRRDVRSDFPTGIYRFAQIARANTETGDVSARAYVRWIEIQRSAAFVLEELGRMPNAKLRAQLAPLAAEQVCVSLVEGWRGEICHVIGTDGSGAIATYKVVDPSFHNWMGLGMALRGQQISDFPLCNKSFNLSYCGFDL